MYKQHHDLTPFINASDNIALIEVDRVHGSTPRDEGTWMLVSEKAIFRTIGGGQLEKMAIEKARNLLQSKLTSPIELRLPLGPHIGQCCGGTIDLKIRVLDQSDLQACICMNEAEIARLPCAYIFGAGHVGRALANALSLLPLHPIVIDTREKELSSIPRHVETRLVAMPESEVRNARPGSAFIILTHDHALDFLITREVLLRKDAAYVGMIGSSTKRATFRNWLRRENGSEESIEHLICPIGNSRIIDKRPEVIAALTASEIIEHLDDVIIDKHVAHSYLDIQTGLEPANEV